MKLNRRKLRKLIISEVKRLHEAEDMEYPTLTKQEIVDAMNSGIDIGMSTQNMAAPALMVLMLIQKKSLQGQAALLYNSLDPRIQDALDSLIAAIQAVPEKMKEGLIESVVDLINGATKSLE